MNDPSAIIPDLNADDWERYEGKAQANTAAFTQDFNDHIAYMRSGGDMSGDYAAQIQELRNAMAENFGDDPEKMALLEAELARAENFNDVAKTILTGDPETVADVLEGLKGNAESGPDDYRANAQDYSDASDLFKTRNKAIKEDAPAYAESQFPDVEQAKDAMEEARESGNPVDLTNASKLYAEQLDARLGTLLGTSDVIGNPAYYGPLLTKGEANSIARAFTIAQDARPENAVDRLLELQAQWGEYWPRIEAQITEDLPAPIRVISNMENRDQHAAAERIAMLAGEKITDMQKSLGINGTQLREDIVGTILKDMEDFTISLGEMTPSNYAMREAYIESMTKLALHYRLTGDQASNKAAAKKAFKEVVTKSYDFGEVNDHAFRVPKKLGADVVRLRRNAEEYILQIANDDIDFVVPRYWMPEDLTSESWLDTLPYRAYWVTNQDETGLILHAETTDGIGHPVMQRINGDIDFVELTWEDINNFAPRMHGGPPPEGRAF
jgi:hypothetical protein